MSDLQRMLSEIVRSIPVGSVMSYGGVGEIIGTSGRQVGRMLAQMEGEGVPWWRVCNARGEFPISKRNPMFENEQRQRLEEERVPFLESGRVDMVRARLES
jgi:methylated-DNA-protein-cysteine methyltransferase-like protein